MAYLPASLAGDPKGRFATLLGLSHLSASLSWVTQASTLIGSQGIRPVATQVSSGELLFAWPHLSLLSLSQSDAWLSTLGWVWALSALLLSARVAPKLTLGVSLVCAVSLSQGASPFLPFQWDILLHEASLIGLLYLPARLGRATTPSNEVGRWLLRLLLFKLIWDSGLSKVLSADELWRSLKALYLHFWTQPLPHVGATVATQLPEFILRMGTYLTIAIELWVPCLLFLKVKRPALLWAVLISFSVIGATLSSAPTLTSMDTLAWLAFAIALDERLISLWRPHLPWLPLGPRFAPGWGPAVPIGILMLLISATGSYGFFQLLTLSLLTPLFDLGAQGDASPAPAPISRATSWSVAGLWVLVSLALHLPWAPDTLKRTPEARAVYQATLTHVSPLQLIARYGLFAQMTRSHDELIIEGSADGERWDPLPLPYQVNGASAPPPMAGLYMPRVDWMMWFEALQPSCHEGWLLDLLEATLEGRAPALSLLTSKATAPTYLRVKRVRYRPSAVGFWSARDAGYYCPAMTLQELRHARAKLRGLPQLP